MPLHFGSYSWVSAAAFFRETHCNSANYSNWMCRILLAIENWFLWSVRQLLVWNTGEEVNQKHFRSLAHFQAAKMNTFDVADNFWHVFASLTNVSLHQWNAHFEAWKFLIEAINILSRAGISCEWNIIRSEFVWRARKNHVVTLAVTFVNEIRGALEHNVTVLNLFTALMPIIPASYCLQSFGTLNASESGVFTVLLCILTVGKTFIMKYFTHYIEFATCYNQLSKLKIDKRRHFMTLKMLHRQSINQNESGEFLAEANCRIRWLVQQIDLEYLFSYVFLIVASIEMTHRVGGKLECRICITLISRQIVIVGHSRVNMRFLLSICIRMSRQQKGYIFKWCFLCCCAFIYMKMQKCLMKPYGKANEVIRFCHQSWFVMHNTCTHNKNILLIESQYKRVSAIDKMSLLTHF